MVMILQTDLFQLIRAMDLASWSGSSYCHANFPCSKAARNPRRFTPIRLRLARIFTLNHSTPPLRLMKCSYLGRQRPLCFTLPTITVAMYIDPITPATTLYAMTAPLGAPDPSICANLNPNPPLMIPNTRSTRPSQR
jgi:hypothetical protein